VPRHDRAQRDDQIRADRPRQGAAARGDPDRMSAARRNAPRLVRDIAHARAGDKGNISNINVWAYDAKDFEALQRTLTPERLKEAFPALIRGKVERYVLPHLHGINLVLHEALEGGVNLSLNLDSHGKSWSYLVLGMEVVEE